MVAGDWYQTTNDRVVFVSVQWNGLLLLHEFVVRSLRSCRRDGIVHGVCTFITAVSFEMSPLLSSISKLHAAKGRH